MLTNRIGLLHFSKILTYINQVLFKQFCSVQTLCCCEHQCHRHVGHEVWGLKYWLQTKEAPGRCLADHGLTGTHTGVQPFFLWGFPQETGPKMYHQNQKLWLWQGRNFQRLPCSSAEWSAPFPRGRQQFSLASSPLATAL